MGSPTFWLHTSLIGRIIAQLIGPEVEQLGWSLRTGASVNAALHGQPGIALLDALDALTLVPPLVILTDLAVLSQYSSAVSLHTPERPDRIASAVVLLDACRSTSQALARAMIEPFFGIRVTRWAQSNSVISNETILTVREDEKAFASLDECHHDLGRAWFILTGEPFISHLLVASPELSRESVRMLGLLLRDLPTRLRDQAAALAGELAAAATGDAGRISSWLRETLNVVTPRARQSLEELVRRSQSGMRPPPTNAYRSLSGW